MPDGDELERLAVEAARLRQRYAEPHRRYHDLAHVERVLSDVDLLADHANHPATVRLAAWFHDAVYDPTRLDNEQRSADLATSTLAALDAPGALTDEVARLVLLTRDHVPPDDDPDGAVLCDADLAVLATPDGDYDDYAAAVRAEYSWVSEGAFRDGRAAVLGQLLNRPRLFHTAPGRDHWEEPARANLRRELANLEAAAP